MSDRLGKPTCLIVASAAAAGVSAQSFLHCFTLASSAFNLQVATPGGKSIDFVDVNESNMRWIQDFRMKSYANPAKLESIDGARYHALLIPNCPGAMTDLANSGYLAKILQHFSTENKPICAVGHGVAALCCATNEDKSWVFQGYSLTGPSVYELVRQPNFASLSIIVEDFVKDSGATFSASSPDAVHVVLDRHLVTGQNENSTLPAVQNLLILCNVRMDVDFVHQSPYNIQPGLKRKGLCAEVGNCSCYQSRYESQENDSAKTINKKVPVDTSTLVNAKLRQTDGPSVVLLE